MLDFKESGVMTAFGGSTTEEDSSSVCDDFADDRKREVFKEPAGWEEETSFSKKELEQVSFLFKEEASDELVFDDSSDDSMTVSRVPIADCDFYQPQEVDSDDSDDSSENSAGEENQNESSSSGEIKIVFKKPTITQSISDAAKFKLLVKKFESGRLVMLVDTESASKPKPLMYLLQADKELMAFRLLSPKLDVVIPNEVCGYPIRYIHPEFLRGSLNPLTGLKFQNLIDNFAVDNLINLNKEKLKDAVKGAKSLTFPNNLVMLPPNLFNYCLALKSVVIPASVTAISVNAFSYSNLKDIWFNGECPAGFLNNVYLPESVKIHVKPEFLDSFRKG